MRQTAGNRETRWAIFEEDKPKHKRGASLRRRVEWAGEELVFFDGDRYVAVGIDDFWSADEFINIMAETFKSIKEGSK